MVINSKSWHYKLYRFMFFFVCSMTENQHLFELPSLRKKPLNICSYIRTIVLWGPLCIFGYILVGGFIGFVALYFPISTYGVAYIVPGIIVGIIFGVYHFFLALEKIKTKKDLEDGAGAGAEEKPLTTLGLAKAWISSKKEKICFIIEVKND